MTLKAQIENDLKAALLGGDRFATDTLRFLKAAILNEEVAKGQRETGLSDDAIQQLVAKECKKREESAALFEQGGNQTSADKERAEKQLMQKYLPTQLSESEIRQIIDEIVADMKPSGSQEMGKVIGAVKARVGTSAEGATVAALVKEKLS